MIPALYIHIPFCSSRCSYCDFYFIKTSHIPNPNPLYQQFILALIQEIKLYHQQFPHNLFSSLYIGGGTPSLLPPQSFQLLCHHLFNTFSFQKNFEFTVETNPDSLDQLKLSTYKNCGVNRISLGCQTFDSSLLKQLGRKSTQSHILNAYSLIKKNQFQNINLDLIIGLPNQKYTHYQNDLKKAVKLNPHHFSCYGLMLDSPFLIKKIQNHSFKLPTENQSIQNYQFTLNFLKKNGYSHYEISSFSKKSKQCQHNLAYWNQKNYLGLGPSAVGTIQQKRYKNLSNVKKYIHSLSQQKLPIHYTETLTPEQFKIEKIMLSLRTSKGLDIRSICQNPKSLQSFQSKISPYLKSGLLIQNHHSISTSKKGLLVLDWLVSKLI